MDWIKLLIPLIVIAVWILSQLAGGQQQQKRPPSSRPFPPRDPRDPDEGGGPRSRRGPEDFEKFLEDMKRRQEAQEKMPPEPVLIAEEVPARPVPPPLPRPAPRPAPRPYEQRPAEQRPAEQRRKSTPVGAKKPQRRVEPVIVVEPAPAVRAVPMPVTAPPVVQAPAAAALPQPIFRPEALPSKTSLPPVARMVRELLKDRQSLAAAFLLREVLDQPLCKRAGRIG